MASQCPHYFTVLLANIDFSLPALPFEFRGLSCQGPYRDLPLWSSSHKFNKITVHTENS